MLVLAFGMSPSSMRYCQYELTSSRTLGRARMPDNETARRISLEYTLAAARVFEETCLKPFRFVYCSGAGAERDQTRPLWFMQNYRRIRVCELALQR